jgi:hypothetical protein
MRTSGGTTMTGVSSTRLGVRVAHGNEADLATAGSVLAAEVVRWLESGCGRGSDGERRRR